jgi:hypothetical protein
VITPYGNRPPLRLGASQEYRTAEANVKYDSNYFDGVDLKHSGRYASRKSKSRLLFFGALLRVLEVPRSYRMCRNIRILFNFDPPVTAEEIRAASLQFVRKISGFNKPSKANEGSFMAAVDDIARISTRLLGSLETNAASRNREEEAAKARARAAERFGT